MFNYPVSYIVITTKFSKSSHKGIDLGWSSKYFGKNQNIYSIGDGEVISIQLQKTGGKVVHIRHNGYVSEYAHMDTIKVRINQKVTHNTIIGTMGGTGIVNGNHLHLGLCIGSKITYSSKDKWVNPVDYLYAKDEIIKKETLNKYNIKYINNEKEKCITYTVKSGDNLSKIAKKYNTTWEQIYYDNKNVIGNNPNLIKIGMKLIIK